MTPVVWPDALDASAGARPLPAGGTSFRVWAPSARRVDLSLSSRLVAMQPGESGWWQADVASAGPGARYGFSVDGSPGLPDPASRSQPDGVHGTSEVVDLDRRWSDSGWRGIDPAELVIYELHVGTFSSLGTFDGVAEQLGELAALGITAIELMPVCQFPGARNWGYDGVFPYAVQDSYGGPHGLQRLVEAAHVAGLAVILDVVYNHLGPEGNRLAEFGPYFTDRYATPWGDAVNFDGPWSDEVRAFFGGTARQWFVDFHLDGLRLDAVHAIHDETARPFLLELAEATDDLARSLGRPLHLIAETDRNDPRTTTPRADGGLGLSAQWNDDFHHALRAVLTGERAGYYADYGSPEALRKAVEDGFVYDGRHSAHRRMRYGAPGSGVPKQRLVVYARNHDQIGNQADGARLTTLLNFEQLKLAAAIVVCAPALPMLFMGEEYAETAPFLYFVDHTDRDLLEAVRRGRVAEFAAFGWSSPPPDPADPATFERSVLDRTKRHIGPGAVLYAWYRELLRLRRLVPALRAGEGGEVRADIVDRDVLVVERTRAGSHVFVYANLCAEERTAELPVGPWQALLDSGDGRWDGAGATIPAQGGEGSDSSALLPGWTLLVVSRGEWIAHADLAR